MDNREDSAVSNAPSEGYDPVSYQLVAIQIRLDGLEAAIRLRNARHRQRAGYTIRTMFTFGFGLVVGAGVAVLIRFLS